MSEQNTENVPEQKGRFKIKNANAMNNNDTNTTNSSNIKSENKLNEPPQTDQFLAQKEVVNIDDSQKRQSKIEIKATQRTETCEAEIVKPIATKSNEENHLKVKKKSRFTVKKITKEEDDLEVRSNDGSSELKNIHFSSLDGLSSVGNLSDPRLISKIEQLLELNMQMYSQLMEFKSRPSSNPSFQDKIGNSIYPSKSLAKSNSNNSLSGMVSTPQYPQSPITVPKVVGGQVSNDSKFAGFGNKNHSNQPPTGPQNTEVGAVMSHPVAVTTENRPSHKPPFDHVEPHISKALQETSLLNDGPATLSTISQSSLSFASGIALENAGRTGDSRSNYSQSSSIGSDNKDKDKISVPLDEKDKNFGKLSHYLNEMKKEIDLLNKQRKDKQLESQRLRERCKQLEESRLADKNKILALEDMIEKYKATFKSQQVQIETLSSTVEQQKKVISQLQLTLPTTDSVKAKESLSDPCPSYHLSSLDSKSPPAIPFKAPSPDLPLHTGPQPVTRSNSLTLTHQVQVSPSDDDQKNSYDHFISFSKENSTESIKIPENILPSNKNPHPGSQSGTPDPLAFDFSSQVFHGPSPVVIASHIRSRGSPDLTYGNVNASYLGSSNISSSQGNVLSINPTWVTPTANLSFSSVTSTGTSSSLSPTQNQPTNMFNSSYGTSSLNSQTNATSSYVSTSSNSYAMSQIQAQPSLSQIQPGQVTNQPTLSLIVNPDLNTQKGPLSSSNHSDPALYTQQVNNILGNFTTSTGSNNNSNNLSNIMNSNDSVISTLRTGNNQQNNITSQHFETTGLNYSSHHGQLTQSGQSRQYIPTPANHPSNSQSNFAHSNHPQISARRQFSDHEMTTQNLLHEVNQSGTSQNSVHISNSTSNGSQKSYPSHSSHPTNTRHNPPNHASQHANAGLDMFQTHAESDKNELLKGLNTKNSPHYSFPNIG